MQTVFTNPDLAIAGTNSSAFEKTWRPSRSWNLGLNMGVVSNQIQQVKTATVRDPTGRGNQGQAKPIQNLRITRTPIGNNQIRVAVSFTPNPSDQYFQGVAVNLSQASNTPLQVAFGKESPIVFSVPRTSKPSTIIAQSIGSLGDTELAGSPAKAIELRS